MLRAEYGVPGAMKAQLQAHYMGLNSLYRKSLL
jgi:hypothetical protein